MTHAVVVSITVLLLIVVQSAMYNAIGFICSIVAVFCDGGLLRLADALLLNDNVRIVMLTVSDVIAFLESFAPPALAEEWDNVGLLLGRKD